MRSGGLLCAALCTALSLGGCGLFEEEDPPPPPPDPALAAASEASRPEPENGPASTPGFSIPGLDGLSIPLPAPQAGSEVFDPPARGSLAPAPAGSWDAQGFMTRVFLEREAEVLHRALLAGLDERELGQVREIPFEVVAEHISRTR